MTMDLGCFGSDFYDTAEQQWKQPVFIPGFLTLWTLLLAAYTKWMLQPISSTSANATSYTN